MRSILDNSKNITTTKTAQQPATQQAANTCQTLGVFISGYGGQGWAGKSAPKLGRPLLINYETVHS